MQPADEIVGVLRDSAQPLTGASNDYDALLELIGDARFVLLGEASHGTHEFYRERAQITKRLIAEKGFTAVAVEADWPDAYRVNRYVRGTGMDPSADAALADFKRFPTWMWRNAEVLDFVGWLRAHNDTASSTEHEGRLLRSRSLQPLHLDGGGARLSRQGRPRGGQAGALPLRLLRSLRRGHAGLWLCRQPRPERILRGRSRRPARRAAARAAEYASRDGRVAADEFFYAEQNARLVKNAEAYYRSMFRGRVSSWNLRDRHMAETLEALIAHLDAADGHGRRSSSGRTTRTSATRAPPRWAERGELNVGQLVRERYKNEAVLVGFTTYSGTVTAASDWDGPAERKRVRPALPDSYEAIFHDAGLDRFLSRLTR